jgi:serine/threonine-protein kinase
MRVCPRCHSRTDTPRCPIDGCATTDEGTPTSSDSLLHRVVAEKYRIIRHIGSGGVGSVYHATHVQTLGDVAVKVLKTDISCDPKAAQRFELEAKNAAALRHPNTVRVLDFGEDAQSGSLYLVMELIEGTPLSRVLRDAGGQMPWRRAVKIVAQVLKSLREAHEHLLRIVHRDIKPQNIMLLDQFGEPDFVKVLDFGLSRALAEEGVDTITPIGTPRYMAPEQWENRRVDGRTDLYSLGCVFYELVVGKPPFVLTDQGLLALALMHRNMPAPRIGEAIGPAVPVGLESLIDRMLAKRLESRPSSAREVLDELECILADDSVVREKPAPPPAAKPLAGAYEVPPPDLELRKRGTQPLPDPCKDSQPRPNGPLIPSPADNGKAVPVAGSRIAMLAALRAGFAWFWTGWHRLVLFGGLAAVLIGFLLWFLVSLQEDSRSLGGRSTGRPTRKVHSDYVQECERDEVAISCTRVGWDFEYHREAPQDRGRAKDFYEKGCNLGDPDGCMKLSQLIGRWGPPDDAKMRELRERACAIDGRFCSVRK